jgi:hypothetical protein
MEQQREMPQFYLHISGVSKMLQPPIKLIYGPYASWQEAQAKYAELVQEPGYEYRVRINQEPSSK